MINPISVHSGHCYTQENLIELFQKKCVSQGLVLEDDIINIFNQFIINDLKNIPPEERSVQIAVNVEIAKRCFDPNLFDLSQKVDQYRAFLECLLYRRNDPESFLQHLGNHAFLVVNHVDKRGQTILHSAAIVGEERIIETLFQFKATQFPDAARYFPLHLALWWGKGKKMANIYEMLLMQIPILQRPSILQVRITGYNLLKYLIYNKESNATFQLFLSSGARLTDQDRDVLEYAIEDNRWDLLKVLRDYTDQKLYKELINSKNGNGETLIHYGILRETVDIECLDFLMEEGGILVEDNDPSMTLFKYMKILHNFLAQKLSEGMKAAKLATIICSIIKRLPKKDQVKIVNGNNRLEQTTLHLAALHQTPLDIVSRFIELGAIFYPDRKGKTPLHIAAASNPGYCWQFLELCKSKMDPKIIRKYMNQNDEKGNTFLIYILKHGLQPQQITSFTSQGATIDFQNGSAKKAPLAYALMVGESLDQIRALGDTPEKFLVKNGSLLHFCAAYRTNFEIVRFLLDQGLSLTQQDEDGNTALHKAVGAKDDELITLFLNTKEASQIINMQNQEGETALCYGIETDAPASTLSILKSHGANDEGLEEIGIHPLHLAIMMGASKQRCIELLDGLSVDEKEKVLNGKVKSTMETILHLAVKYQADPEVIALLISHGAKNQPDEVGNYPFHNIALESKEAIAVLTALFMGLSKVEQEEMVNRPNEKNEILLLTAVLNGAKNIPLITLLVELGSDRACVTSGGDELFFVAIDRGSIETCRLLLKDLTAQEKTTKLLKLSKEGMNSLHLALAAKAHFSMVEFLLNELDEDNRRTIVNTPYVFMSPLVMLIVQENSSLEIFRLLLAAGADPGKKITMNINGNELEITIFQFILQRSSIEELEKRYEILLDHTTAAQRDFWLNDSNDIPLLEFAIIEKMSPKMLLLLIKMGVRWDQQIDNHAPLHTLAMYNKEPAEWVELLGGMDPAIRRRLLHMQDAQGNTVLHCLVQYQNFKIIKLVVDWGAELNIQNKKGESPLHLMNHPARREYSVLRLLLKAGANPYLLDYDNKKALEDPEYVLARGKLINQWRRKINAIVDENERIKELHYDHDQEAKRSLFVNLQALDDENGAFSLYLNKLDFHFDGLIRFSHEHRQTRFQLVESPASIYHALEATDDGSISILHIEGHGPGEAPNRPSRVALADTGEEITYLSAGDERLIELLQKKMELPDPSLEKREPTKGLIIWDSCGLANGETNMCEEVARRVKGVTVIGSEINTKGFYTRFYPERAIPVRFFGGENGSVEGTVIYEGESRVKYSNYMDKLLIEDYFNLNQI